MQNIILDEEFRALLPTLDNEAFAQLEVALNLENRYK